jgi:hypothetical protein
MWLVGVWLESKYMRVYATICGIYVLYKCNYLTGKFSRSTVMGALAGGMGSLFTMHVHTAWRGGAGWGKNKRTRKRDEIENKRRTEKEKRGYKRVVDYFTSSSGLLRRKVMNSMNSWKSNVPLWCVGGVIHSQGGFKLGIVRSVLGFG